MALELIEDALGDARNARALAKASELAYCSADAGAEKFKEQLGLAAKLLSAGNTQAFVGTNDDHIVVAFRGTEAPTSIEGLKDWLLTDAMNLLIVPKGKLGNELMAAGVGARFHQGFTDALADIWPGVSEAVEAEMKKEERPLWLTGHSLGGALALLAAWVFKQHFVTVHQVYTFGAPMVGNEDAAKAFDREFPNRIYRYVAEADPVPRLPTVSMIANRYFHCDKCVGAKGALGLGEMFSGIASKAVEGVLTGSLMGDLWKDLLDRVGAHNMDNYHKLIE